VKPIGTYFAETSFSKGSAASAAHSSCTASLLDFFLVRTITNPIKKKKKKRKEKERLAQRERGRARRERSRNGFEKTECYYLKWI
jgi:hypothetical protein